MSLQKLLATYQSAELVTKLAKYISSGEKHIQIAPLMGSALSFVMSALFKKNDKTFLLVFENKEKAAYYLNDFEQLTKEKESVLFFPGSYRRPYQIEETDNVNILLRTEVLNRINSRKKPALIITYADALFEKVITKAELNRSVFKIQQGDKLSLDFLNEVLFEYHFQKTDFVTEPGEFAVRGGIIDIYSYSHDQPYRIEFFGEEVESIRLFDITSQLTIEKVRQIQIMPNISDKSLADIRQSFLSFIGKKTLVYIQDEKATFDKIQKLYQKAEESFQELTSPLKQSEPQTLFTDAEGLKKDLQEHVCIKNSFSDQATKGLNWKTSEQPAFNKHFELLIKNLQENTAQGFQNYLFCDNEKQAQRFHDIFADMEVELTYETLVFPLYRGFVDTQLKIACYTDHQIFNRYHKFRLKQGYQKKQAISLKELTSLQKGDYVTHIDHGIGVFGGLQKIEVEGKMQEAIKLMYGERDILYVSIHSLHKISKYNGKEGTAPKIYKLGSGAWKKIKQKTKRRIKEIAFDLISLYAKRKEQKGFQYQPDSYMQHELEASFMYEDTPDQLQATLDVKSDMENDQPMDRLVCGDVGFGKTEVAMRAAFKAVDNGKQVAVLVPTTILAFQHFRSFSQRLEDFPIRVDYLNRFRSTKQKNQIIKDLADGSMDIIIGTHQLVSEKVKFKDLGLLIIDEEQKFGVNVKDKLKTIKENVDTLTLTATPIPRTLQFSLMAARDLSLINTAPPNRHPIETQVIRFNDELIRDALQYEISRGGQVFFIHNRIENIQEMTGMLQRLLPDAKIGIGHGQMEGKKLEKVMLAFINNEFDILVSTTIIENGLDVPNANTIFINNAQSFGLADLHQMRGRVGRSNKKAFCYLITPPFEMINTDARKRVEALQIFSDLGSGFNIAMKDLEIRGAGDLLGAEQSGFINDIGFETYQKILHEAIEELKEKEFKDMYTSSDETQKEFSREVQIDTDMELHIPDDYINIIAERLNLYTELSKLKDQKELESFSLRVADRFGKLPKEFQGLIKSVELKFIAKRLGIEKLVLKQNKMIGYFIAEQNSPFYQSQTFQHIIRYAQTHPSQCSLKEKNTRNGLRLLISFKNVDSIQNALNVLSNLLHTIS